MNPTPEQMRTGKPVVSQIDKQPGYVLRVGRKFYEMFQGHVTDISQRRYEQYTEVKK